MCRALVLLLSALLVFSARVSTAQTISSFEDLALRVNLNDTLRVVDQSGKDVSGTLTRLTREALTLRAASGDVTVPLTSVRSVSLVGHALGRGALIGGALFAGLNLIAKNRNGDAGGAAGAFGAALAGAGIGTGIGAALSTTQATFTAPVGGIPATTATTSTRFFDDLALRVNLDDELQIENTAGQWTSGQLARLTDDAITLSGGGGERVFQRAHIQRVATTHRPTRAAALIGGAAGAIAGAALGCSGSDKSECFDGALLLGGAGAGAGALIGSLIPQRTTVFSLGTATTATITPVVARRGAGIAVQLRW